MNQPGINILVPNDDCRVLPSYPGMEFGSFCDKIVYEIQYRIRLFSLKTNNMFRKCLVYKQGFFTSARVHTDDWVNGLHWFPSEDSTAILNAVFTLFDTGVECSEGLQIAAERWGQALVSSNHTDILGIPPTPLRDRKPSKERCGWRLALK